MILNVSVEEIAEHSKKGEKLCSVRTISEYAINSSNSTCPMLTSRVRTSCSQLTEQYPKKENNFLAVRDFGQEDNTKERTISLL